MVFLQLNDAYEEVDEQRGNVSAWKRRTHKAQGEMNDIRYVRLIENRLL